jgi:predicted ATP-grasp superfamily ATP-dependent carboligase
MQKIIILNGTELGYQVIRALGEQGVGSIVIYDREQDEIGRYSKYVVESFNIPGFIENPDNLLQFLIEKKTDWAGTLIIPTKDHGIEFLAQNKETLSTHYIIPLPDYKIINGIINKKLLYQQAKKIDVPVPNVFYPESIEDIYKIKDEITYPILLKPGRGHVFYRKMDLKVIQVESFQELLAQYQRITGYFNDDPIDLIVSDIIPGPDNETMIQFASYLDESGQLLASMTSRKLRQDPPLYGYGRVIKSEKNHDVDEISLKLLKELKYHGFSEIEWKLDRRDGRYKLIEINARPIFYIGLCVRCGINFPYIQYLDLVRQKKLKIDTYKENIYWIHLYKDLLHTILHHKLEDITFRDYIHPYLRKKVFAVLNFKDPLPFCQQWKQHIFNMFKKILNRMLRN